MSQFIIALNALSIGQLHVPAAQTTLTQITELNCILTSDGSNQTNPL